MNAPKIVMYGEPGCPDVYIAQWIMKLSNIDYHYINIQEDQSAAAEVRDHNDGREKVPTIQFPDGSILTEPSVHQLHQKLSPLGYNIGLLAWLIGAWRWLLFCGFAVWLLLDMLSNF